MRRLYVFNLKKTLRDKMDMFWALIFPLVMATLFYASFGSGKNMEQMQVIPTAVVEQEGGQNPYFTVFLEGLDEEVLALQYMTAEAAVQALKAGEVDGIFYAAEMPSLTVSGSGLKESILVELLNGYLQNEALIQESWKTNPAKLPAAIQAVQGYRELIKSVTPGGNQADNNLSYFFALVGMACLFGSFMGMTAAENLRADQSSLAARRSIAPLSRRVMVISEMLAVFTVQFFNVCVLLLYLRFAFRISFGEKWYLLLPVCVLGSMTGVAWGIFIGSLRGSEGLKAALLVGSSLLMSFLAGMMLGTMKDIIAHHVPVLNKINPAALISDAFYSISVYENPARYRMNLCFLAGITVLLISVSFMRLGRERYDSI